ncbi:hypothetical protein SDC9_96722 [bioreactor metagenome]|uniref:Uncharacterized protein n=1 Tax=bioreactor metagenome TaxID=1076179 RepID=A0A645ABB0_9ZZZZ
MVLFLTQDKSQPMADISQGCTAEFFHADGFSHQCGLFHPVLLILEIICTVKVFLFVSQVVEIRESYQFIRLFIID